MKLYYTFFYIQYFKVQVLCPELIYNHLKLQ